MVKQVLIEYIRPDAGVYCILGKDCKLKYIGEMAKKYS